VPLSWKRLNALLFCLFLLALSTIVYAQERCGTVQYTERLKSRNQIPSDDQIFEQWVRSKTAVRQSSQSLRTASTYQVPVVVHVIHNGEAVGTGRNIPDEQILSQIQVLNEDFNRINADQSSTPAEFAGIAGQMNIEFVLAKQDPEGLATDGIVRVKGSKATWTINDNYQLKATSYWPAEDYFNIWVCDISDYLGYTQFPESSLPGLENASNNRLTDGVVIWYRAFGSLKDGAFNLDPKYGYGRTTTHEVGHFLGLRHIWGDDGASCSGEDYVSDTPNQSGNSSGCPSHPRVTCTVSSMFQNFLDYTDDVCMNLFTQGQVQRMSTVIENSPRRNTLLNSHALFDPLPLPNDLGIREIVSPLSAECSNAITPIVVVRNYGSNNVTSATIRYSINGVLAETKTFNLSLDHLETAEVTFESKTVTAGANSFSFEIIQTNGGSDPVLQNNIETVNFSIPDFGELPFSETLESMPALWSIENPDQQYTWELTTAPNFSQDNKALFMNFFDYEDKFGELDVFASPVFDLSAAPVASLVFDVAHARYQASNDRLKIVVLRECESIDNGTVVYDKSGSTLATTASQTNSFVPDDENDWRREFVDLSEFIGEDHIQIAFIGVNDWGNNVYIDNIAVIITALEDVALYKVVSPTLVTCDKNPSPILLVKNLGNVTINNFTVEYTVNNDPKKIGLIDNISLASVGEINVGLPQLSLHEGANTIKIEITNPNGDADETPLNNIQEFTVMVKSDKESIPLRETFDATFDSWTSVNPTGGMKWETIATPVSETSIYFDSYDNTDIGDEAWFISPVLDFSQAIKASLEFDISKRTRIGKSDDLKLYASRDCGNTYEPVTFSIASETQPLEWKPAGALDWEQATHVDLSKLSGEDQVRIAFVVTNKNGNNIYIDNLEFFATENSKLDITTPYSIFGYSTSDLKDSELAIVFDLPERETVHYSIVDMMGHTFARGDLDNVLNQTWTLDVEKKLPSGVYVVRLKIGDKFFAERIVVAR
jgi:hypothetical protein